MRAAALDSIVRPCARLSRRRACRSRPRSATSPRRRRCSSHSWTTLPPWTIGWRLASGPLSTKQEPEARALERFFARVVTHWELAAKHAPLVSRHRRRTVSRHDGQGISRARFVLRRTRRACVARIPRSNGPSSPSVTGRDFFCARRRRSHAIAHRRRAARPATRKVLVASGLPIDAMDVFEMNETFASVALVWEKACAPNPERVNPSGGAIAIGHPTECTGARLTPRRSMSSSAGADATT